MMANNTSEMGSSSTDNINMTLSGGGGDSGSSPSMLSNGVSSGLKQGRSKVWNEFTITPCGTRVRH